MAKQLTNQEIVAKGIAGARVELIASQRRLKGLRFQAAAADLKDVRSIRQLKRSIARLKTFINNQ